MCVKESTHEQESVYVNAKRNIPNCFHKKHKGRMLETKIKETKTNTHTHAYSPLEGQT